MTSPNGANARHPAVTELTFLTVIWFQGPSDQVVHPDAVARMYDMPWDDLARDLTFDDM
ncbi:hypothetical protein [Thermomonospora amylolytica]|uniref:hypothetical protein n=1 Tax=Thermomonospora amylolytica TaxID=1411117 RepID=UPI0018E58408|nr:hypothetical protein [Thermomonospora amylolytica]